MVQDVPQGVRPRLQLAEPSALGRSKTGLAAEPRGVATGNEDRQDMYRLRWLVSSEAMEWDHLPGTIKLGAISNKIRTWSRKLIFEELAKCELVCANCDAIRTYRRLREATSGV